MGQDTDENTLWETLLRIEWFIAIPECILSCLGAIMIILSVFRSKTNRKNVQQKQMGFMSISDFLLPFLRLTGFLWIPSDHGLTYLGNDIVQPFTISIDYQIQLEAELELKSGFISLRLSMVYFGDYLQLPSMLKMLQRITMRRTFVRFNTILISQSPMAPMTKPNKFQTRVITVLWALFAAMYLSIILLNIICIVTIYKHVKKTEMRSFRWKSANATQLVKTAEVATQFRYFAMVFFVPGTIFVIVYFVNRAGGGKLIPGPYLSFTLLLVCSAGFLNSLVYFRFRYKRMRKETPTAGGIATVKIIQDVLFPCCKPCCEKKNVGENLSLTDHTDSEDDHKDYGPVLEDFVEPPSSIRVPPGASDWKSLKALGIKTVHKQNKVSQKGDWRSLNALGVNTIEAKEKIQTPLAQMERLEDAKDGGDCKTAKLSGTNAQTISDDGSSPLFPIKAVESDEDNDQSSNNETL